MLELKTYVDGEEVVLQFEHSLRSLSKWESKHKRAFMATRLKTPSEMIDYYRDMLVTPGVDPNLVYALDPDQLEKITHYINSSQTATVVPESHKPTGASDEITSDLIYYWLVAMKINWEAQDWHLDRLMTLIKIIDFKTNPPKKRRPSEIMSDWHKANERQKKLLGTRG